MSTKIYEDNYCQYFGIGEYADLITAQKELESATHWETDVSTPNMLISALTPDTLAEAKSASSDRFSGIPEEILKDTLVHSGLVLHYEGKNVCLRECGMKSLLATIDINGGAIARASKPNLAGGLNYFIPGARTRSKVMLRAEKISAVLSMNYKYMPVTDLLAVCGELEKTFGPAAFLNGSVSHDLTTAQFEFPASAGKITAAYHSALESSGRRSADTLIPVVQFRTSDTSDEAAKIVTYLKFGPSRLMPIGGFSVKHIDPKKEKKATKHLSCMDKFKEEASLLFSKMQYDINDLIPRMLDVQISHPGNTFVGVCKYAGISQKWGGEIEEEIRSDFPDGSECSFLDLYERMTEVTAKAIRAGFHPSSQRVQALEEGITKVARHRESWKRYDLPGTVAWSQAASSLE